MSHPPSELIFEHFDHLERHLIAGQWEAADRTTLVLLFVLNGTTCRDSESPGLLHYHFSAISTAHVAELDRLWVRYSQGRFGFSVQWQIWQDLRQELAYAPGTFPSIADEETFAERIGRADRFYPAGATDFSLHCPAGHLPWLNWRDRSDSNRINGLIGGGGIGWNAVFCLPGPWMALPNHTL